MENQKLTLKKLNILKIFRVPITVTVVRIDIGSLNLIQQICLLGMLFGFLETDFYVFRCSFYGLRYAIPLGDGSGWMLKNKMTADHGYETNVALSVECLQHWCFR